MVLTYEQIIYITILNITLGTFEYFSELKCDVLHNTIMLAFEDNCDLCDS